MRCNSNQEEEIAVVLNFTPVERTKYKVGVPKAGEYAVVLSTNSKRYGGDGKGSKKVKAKKKPYGGYPYSIELNLPPLTGYYLRFVPHKEK